MWFLSTVDATLPKNIAENMMKTHTSDDKSLIAGARRGHYACLGDLTSVEDKKSDDTALYSGQGIHHYDLYTL